LVPDIDPSTPVLVGVAAVQQRLEEAGAGLDAVGLMIEALTRAADDAGSRDLLRRADRIEVPKGIWSYTDPARLIADALGAEKASTVLAEIGILQQSLMNRACRSIAGGEAEIVLVSGGEAKYRALRGQIEGVEVSETRQSDVIPDITLQPDAELWSPVESETGLGMPVGFYAIMDSALRRAQGLSVEQHREQMGRMYQSFSEVAASNPYAWSRKPVTADFVRVASPANRMLAFPYTKLHNTQWNVDQAAGLIFCSAAIATELGIARERWIFPTATSESNAMSVVSARAELDRNYGFHFAGRRVLEMAAKTADEVGFMELYSCFPQAVRVQLQELNLDPERALTVTGAMTFGGGPLNNFVLQATVRMAQLLRENPGETGLVTSVSGMNTKQACALYSGEPNTSGWQFDDVTAQVEAATGLYQVIGDYCGDGVIAGFTVLFKGDTPWRGVAVCTLPGNCRTVAWSEDPATLAAMQETEFCGRAVTLDAGRFTLQV
jgi:acetyl-CoA C-acetyltransferase